MASSLTLRRVLVFAAVLVLVGATLTIAGLIRPPERGVLPRAAADFLDEAAAAAEQAEVAKANGEAKNFEEMVAGSIQGGPASESADAATLAKQWAEARTAPGIVNPGAYTAALAQLTGLATIGGAWSDVTAVPYDADDPVYRDYYSNSSGGSGLVTGRITALAADNNGYVYAGGANGGVWRSSQGGGNWSPIADSLLSLSSGDLQIASDGSLWYATGEANTGGTSYVGSGVYRLAAPTSGTFATSDRVGGTELESTTINAIRFVPGADKVYVATLRGVYSHKISGNFTTAWSLVFAPNAAYLPGGASAADPNAAYKNIINDIAIDPANPSHIIAAAGWRSGDTYNGFYESMDAGTSWTKVNPGGAINPKDIGNVTFAWSADGKKLYVINQSPLLLQKAVGTVNSYLDGIYVADNGKIAGPYTKIAESHKLANSGSALKQSVGGKGYGPGIQSWYNQFLIVDPTDANHVYAGLEEIYETKNGGATWTTVGPYWNFYFPCWAPDSVYPPNGASNRCPQTTHPDQQSAAVGTYNGVKYFFAGNDGGVYRRPLNGAVNANGNATDWQSLNDGTIDALQYYAVGIGKANGANPRTPSGTGVIVSGGLQDNGGSIFRIGGDKMSSNFGGDGGDVLVDPNDGCNILQEYVVLSLSVTQTCANPDPATNPNAFLDLSQSTTFKVAPPDINARFIAPFVADDQNIDNWLAGGNSIWFQDNGFAIRSGSEWKKVYTFADAGKVATAMAYNGEWAVAGWCGPCNNAGFTRGIAVGRYDGTTWSWSQPLSSAALTTAGVPNRFVGGAAVDDAGNIYVVMNGFSRRFTEGPGAGVGHVFKSTDGGATWTSLDDKAGTADFPDVPANSIKVMASGALVVGTDLGVLYLDAAGTGWKRVGTGLPVTVAIDVEFGPAGDAYLYAATHGRGIWKVSLAGL